MLPGRRKARALLLGVAAALVCDAALSLWIGSGGVLLGRSLPPFGAITHPRQREWLAREQVRVAAGAQGEGAGMFDAELGWTMRRSYEQPGGAVHTNSIAARGTREYPLQPTQGIRRLVFVGDSFIWGDGVQDRETFEAQLEGIKIVEAINLGVPAYGTDQALLRFRREGAPLRPEIACLGIMLENIGRNVNRYRPLWYPATAACGVKPRFLLEDGELRLLPHGFASDAEQLAAVADGSVLERLGEHEFWRGKPALGAWRFSSFVRILGAWRGLRERDVQALWLDSTAEPYRVTLALAQQFERDARAAGAREVWVLVFPREDDLGRLDRFARRFWWTDASLQMRSMGLRVFDATDALLAAGGGGPVSVFYGNGHLNGAGNRVVATWLARSLDAPR